MSYQKIGKNLLFLVLISIQVCATGYIKQAELTTLKHQRWARLLVLIVNLLKWIQPVLEQNFNQHTH